MRKLLRTIKNKQSENEYPLKCPPEITLTEIIIAGLYAPKANQIDRNSTAK